MTSMNQVQALVYLMKTSRNSTANRNIACASGVHRHFAVPLVPPLERDSQEKPPEAALPCCHHCKGAVREFPLLHPSSTSNTASTPPQGQEREAKSLCKEAGISQHCCLLHCVLLAPEVSQLPLPRAEMPCIPPGRDVCYPYLLQLWLY